MLYDIGSAPLSGVNSDDQQPRADNDERVWVERCGARRDLQYRWDLLTMVRSNDDEFVIGGTKEVRFPQGVLGELFVGRVGADEVEFVLVDMPLGHTGDRARQRGTGERAIQAAKLSVKDRPVAILPWNWRPIVETHSLRAWPIRYKGGR